MKKQLLVSLLVIVLAAVGVVPTAAQEDNTNTYNASNGLSVTFPATWLASEDEGLTIFDLETSLGITFRVGDEITFSYSSADASSVEALATSVSQELSDGGASVSEPVTLEIQGNPAIQYNFGFLGVAAGSSITAFQASTGEIILMEVLNLTGVEITPELTEIIITIADSVTIGEALEVADSSEIVIPAQPLTYNQMPDGKVIFSTGVSFDTPIDFNVVEEPDSEVYSNMTFTNESQTGFLIVDDLEDEVTNRSELEQILRILAPGVLVFTNPEAAEADLTTVSPLEFFEVLDLEDGRRIYQSVGSTDGVVIGIYMIEALPGRFIWVQGQNFIPVDNPEEYIENLNALALSVRFDASIIENPAQASSGAPVEVDSDTGEITAVQDVASCISSAFSYDFSASETNSIQVTCPANCTAGSLWGTDIYTGDSSICTAAIHAGVITADGGEVLVTLIPDGAPSHPGTEQNGISSSDWDSYAPSFSVSAP